MGWQKCPFMEDFFIYQEIPLEFPGKQKTLRVNDAQLAEKKFIAAQYRSRAEIARSAIFF